MDYFLAIRFFGLLIVSLYAYWKILDIKDVSKVKIAAAVIFSLVASIPLSFLPPPPIFELAFLGSVLFFVAIMARVRIPLMIAAVIISVGVNLGLDRLAFLVILLVIAPIQIIYYTTTGAYFIYFSATETQMFDGIYIGTVLAITQPIVFIMLIAFANFLFKIKRLQKGILFWENKQAIWIGLFFSILIMINMSVLGISVYHNPDAADVTFSLVFPQVVINICTFGIYFWWRYHTTALYQQRIKEREIGSYVTKTEDSKKQIASLTESNDFLSETVHRDNKLIPAMYNAVNRFLDSQDSDISTEAKNKGLNILGELDEIMRERKNMILGAQRKYKVLPLTGMERIDNILNYMLSKATENEIWFDFSVAEDIKKIAENTIPSGKLGTLLADLIENAIIAVSYSSHKKISVEMDATDNCLELNIQDSGISFEVETLANLGIEKSTTHADTCGSGIGYMVIFEIIKESDASLTITEHVPEGYTFTKSVKVLFDGKRGYTISSYRANEIKSLIKRTDMYVLEHH